MQCPFCGKEIADSASFCPRCGNDLRQPTEESSRQPEGPAKPPKKKRRGCLIVVLILLVVALAAAFVFLYRNFVGIHIVLDEKQFIYDETQKQYYPAEDEFQLQGRLTGDASLARTMRYEVYDKYENLLSAGDAVLDGDRWSVESPGMVKGPNTVKITANLRVGQSKRTFVIVNSSVELIENTSLDLSDSDDDGILDYLELQFGTATDSDDSDGDGLTDYVELEITGTDPTLYSTEDDGICDADRDSDGDGLSNADELAAGTDPGCADTDFDGLSDSEEPEEYGTDPLQPDTDGDGALDGWEVSSGTDPLVPDKSFDVSQSASAPDSAVSASVELSCSGSPAGLTVEPTTEAGLLDSTVPGYLGSAYTFSFGGPFESATVTMTVDSASLPAGADPAIYRFNEETQLLQEMETHVEGTHASAEVTDQATYVLLDRRQVPETIGEDVLTPEEIDETVVHIAFAVDYSSSMDENDPDYLRLQIAKEYISKLRAGHDAGALVKFAGYATTLVPLSSDLEMLANAVDGITNTGSDSCSYDDAGTDGTDGLRHAMDELETSNAATSRYIIFLTDGEDTSSSYSYDDLIQEAVDNGIVIYTVGMGDCNGELLQRIAESTGGKYRYAASMDYELGEALSLEDIFEEIEQETVDYYADSNNDGLSDYYTRLICEGRLTTGTGSNPFAGVSYDEVQSNDDFDGDGLRNGDEVTVKIEGKWLYLYYYSSPSVVDTDGDGYADADDERRTRWDVGDRDLLVFSSLTYQDGSSKRIQNYDLNSIYSPLDGKGADAEILKHWSIVDSTKDQRLLDTFDATTYKCENNIVITYTGTEGLGEWIDDIVNYGLMNCHSQEVDARFYALRMVAAFPNCKIYVTGHSLGGYLTQIGTAAILETTPVKPAGVAYFNGIGMNFRDGSGISHLLKPGNMKSTSLVNRFCHITDIEVLCNYAATGHLNSYRIWGDLVSSLGTHYAKDHKYNVTLACLKDHTGDRGGFIPALTSAGFASLTSLITSSNLIAPYEYYKCSSYFDMCAATHVLPNFFAYVTQGNRTSPSPSA